MKPLIEIQLSIIESHLRVGQRVEAQQYLTNLVKDPSCLQRKFLPILSSQLRRSGLSEMAVKLLFPFVRRKGLNLKISTTEEKQEYAAALLDLGAIDEAKVLLNELKPLNSSKTYLYLGFLAMGQWNYKTAKINFIQFLQNSSLSSEYETLIGAVNLKACEVFLCDSKNESLRINQELNELIRITYERNFKVLFANLNEIQSQLFIKNKQLIDSKNHLDKISHIINNPQSKDHLFIQKWDLISKKPNLNASIETKNEWIQSMLNLQLKAISLAHSETAHDIDFHLAAFSPELVIKVYFGTKSQSFRKKILDTYSFLLPAYYWHTLNKNNSRYEFQLDCLTYPDLKPGSIVHRVLMALVCDFYQLQNKYSLIFKIFPNDFFNPQTSINKLHQALSRTRKWLLKNKIPFKISEQDSKYSLVGNGRIKIYLSDINNHKDDLKVYSLMEQLKQKLSHPIFTSKEVVSILQLNGPRKAQRMISNALKIGIIQNVKKNGRTFHYSFTTSNNIIMKFKL